MPTQARPPLLRAHPPTPPLHFPRVMQLLLLALALGVLVYDGLMIAPPEWTTPVVLAAVVLPKLVVGGLYWAACITVRRRLGDPGAIARLKRLDRLTSGLQYFTLALYAVDLYLGLLPRVRTAIGNLILIDELLVMLPTLALLLWAWWAYYPVDAKLRESGLIARLDAGLPLYPIWTRTQYMIAQVRHQVVLVFVPVLAIMAWIETVEQVVPSDWVVFGTDPRPAVVVGGALVIFLVAPLMLRYLWDTTPLPRGEVRDMLTALCRRHRVRVRELLLWRTSSGGGGMINAAVMGAVAPVRYILLTDALLDMLEKRQVEAVMAHELAHVRKHHMFWLLASAIGTLGLLQAAAYWLVRQATPASTWPPGVATAGWSGELLTHPYLLESFAALAALGGWVLAFGWVSRRIERQADTFAVQSLAEERRELERESATASVTIDAESVHAMVSALQQVARLNHIPIRRRSWRHGSILWRQDYLRSLVGQRIGDASIDRQMNWIKLAVGLELAALIAIYFLLPPDLRPSMLLGI